jgi:3-isopropylmalate/(R)-2-methylmalate dehydratase small subunit
MNGGRAWVLGDHVDTDAIISGRYLTNSDPRHLAGHLLEDLRPMLAEQVRRGDFIVAGRNFGCGSSREHAPLAIKAAGIAGVVAHSFSRIFFRNAFNMGLMIFISPQASTEVREGDHLRLHPLKGVIENLDQGVTYQAQPVDPFLLELVKDGGLMPRVMRQLGR